MTRERKLQKTKIEWTDYTWNPIKGICPVDCWYCYGKRIYQRFKLNPKMGFELHDHLAIDRLQRKNIPDGSKVFVCSTFELFHPKVPKSWGRDIFSVINCNSKITFQILTKFPQNIDRPMPDNVWLGVTVTGADETKDCFRVETLERQNAKIKFISYEPMLHYSGFLLFVDWLIMGKLTQFGHKYDPKRHWIEEKITQAKKRNIPIFLKDNLKEIWAEPLIQEFPCVA